MALAAAAHPVLPLMAGGRLRARLRQALPPLTPVRVLRLEDVPPIASPPSAAVGVWHDCLVMPGARGLHDRQGRPLPGTTLERGSPARPGFPLGALQPLDPPAELIEWPSAAFLPAFFQNHFGHLLTESAAWLWPFLDPGVNPLQRHDAAMPLLLGTPPGDVQAAPALAALLGLPAGRVLGTGSLTTPLLCRTVYVPVPSMVNRRWVAPHHFLAVRRLLERLYRLSPGAMDACLAAAAAGGRGKLYLSRSRLSPDQRRLHAEEQLEEELARRGWSIVHPQQLPIEEQLLRLAAAGVIAGELGSALHLLMAFGRDMAPRTVIGLGVHGIQRDQRVINFFEQLRHQPVDFHYLCCLGFRQRRNRPGVSWPPADRRLLVSPAALARRLESIATAAGPG